MFALARGYRRSMDGEHHEQESPRPPSTPPSTAYTEDAHLDVEQRFRDEMEQRGYTVTDDEWVAELAHNIRSGHPIVVGRTDASKSPRILARPLILRSMRGARWSTSVTPRSVTPVQREFEGVYAATGVFVCFEGGEGSGKSTQSAAARRVAARRGVRRPR